MGERLNLLQIVVLVTYSLGMAGGQILFKYAAIRSNPGLSLGERLFELIQNRYFLSALVIYAGLSVLWIWILTITPLSRAYPFVALAFIVKSLVGSLLFNEEITIRLVAGMTLIVCGLYLVAA